MYCSGHLRGLLLTAAMLLSGTVFVLAQTAPANPQTNSTEVHLRWGSRPGVSRYRLQLASDNAFADIVFDRVVAGNEYQIKDLPAGRYFWRIAPLLAFGGYLTLVNIVFVTSLRYRLPLEPFMIVFATPRPKSW